VVEDTGETLRAEAYWPVNAPQPIDVEESADGLPLAVKAAPAVSNAAAKKSGRRAGKSPLKQAVLSIEERWRIDDEWWRREPVSRLYYSVRLDSGHRLALYKDLISDRWYRQAY
jgi:hypothetical protein